MAKKKIATDEFKEESAPKINWFPGHMNKAMNEIKKRLSMVHLVVEVRDARSPMTTGNDTIKKMIGEKSHLVVCNKVDLADPQVVEKWQKYFDEKTELKTLFIHQDQSDLKKVILQKAKHIVHQRRLTSNPDAKPSDHLKMMIIGLPNTGKSSLINRLAGRNASKVANKPGQTQRQLWVNIDGKQLEILDTPGVMPPQIERHEHGLWLAALHAIPDRIVEPELPACYLIEHFQKLNHKIFAKHFTLENLPGHSVIEVLNDIASTRGCLNKGGDPDYDRVYHIILNDFRAGKFGQISLGLPPTL
jgi:ribosome biogenesis GTPase A